MTICRSPVPRRATSGTSMTYGRSSPSPSATNEYDLKVRQLTLQEVESVFEIMTTLANQLSRAANKEICKIINAKTGRLERIKSQSLFCG